MPPRRLVWAFVALWMTLGLVLLVASARTFLHALGGHSHAAGNPHLALLAGVEALGAALFLLPRTLRAGGILLLLTLAIAFILHALSGEFPMILLLYAAGTVFVLVHGPVSWGMITGRRSHGPAA